MKTRVSARIAVLLVLAAISIATLCGVYGFGVSADDTGFAFELQTSADITSGVSAEMDRMYYPAGINYVSYIITNKTENEVTYGEFFRIEKYENGEWVDAPSPSAFTFMGYSVPPYSSTRVFVTIIESEQYAEGIYRVCRSDLTVLGEKYEYYLEFAVIDEAEPQVPIRELLEQPYEKRDWEWIYPYDLMNIYYEDGFYTGGYLHIGGDALTVVRYANEIYETGIIMFQKYDFVDMTTGERFPITDKFMTYEVDFLSLKGVFSAVTMDGVVYTAELSDDGSVIVTTDEPFPVDEYLDNVEPLSVYTSYGVEISASQREYRPSEMMVLLEFESIYTEDTVESLAFSADYYFEKLTERGWEPVWELGLGSAGHELLSEGISELLIGLDTLPESGRYRICFTNVSFEMIEALDQPEPREYAVPPEEYEFCLEFNLVSGF